MGWWWWWRRPQSRSLSLRPVARAPGGDGGRRRRRRPRRPQSRDHSDSMCDGVADAEASAKAVRCRDGDRRVRCDGRTDGRCRHRCRHPPPPPTRGRSRRAEGFPRSPPDPRSFAGSNDATRYTPWHHQREVDGLAVQTSKTEKKTTHNTKRNKCTSHLQSPPSAQPLVPYSSSSRAASASSSVKLSSVSSSEPSSIRRHAKVNESLAPSSNVPRRQSAPQRRDSPTATPPTTRQTYSGYGSGWLRVRTRTTLGRGAALRLRDRGWDVLGCATGALVGSYHHQHHHQHTSHRETLRGGTHPSVRFDVRCKQRLRTSHAHSHSYTYKPGTTKQQPSKQPSKSHQTRCNVPW